MDTTQYPKRKRQITRRLRIALLTCAAAAATIPVIVYFATAAVMKRQEDLSGRLIASVAHSAELNAALIRLADDTDQINLLGNPADVQDASVMALAELKELRQDFADEFSLLQDAPEAQRIAERLADYQKIVSLVSDNRVAQLRSLKEIAQHRTLTQRTLRSTNSEVLSNIATTSARFERSMFDVGQSASSLNATELRSDFQTLTLYRALIELLIDVEERVADIDPIAAIENPDGMSAKLRFLTRGLATRIAKVPDMALRETLARNVQSLSQTLLGPQSLTTAYTDYLAQRESGIGIANEQSKITEDLLNYSGLVIESSKADALQGSNDIADMMRDNRLKVFALSSLILLTLLALLFFVVGRRFSRRISNLTDSVLAIAHGDVDHKIKIDGNDELTAMGDALRVFRENRRNLARTNDELAIRNAEVQEVGTRLKTILDTTTSGIIAFNTDGEIIMVNLPGRQFLGGLSQATPFDWPGNIDFLDSEDLSPLEASKNPIRRALAGQNLKSEIALMERSEGDEARYMRISSATVQKDTSPVRCVIVLEDVSEAEKNRQQVERSGRLDALGQLTGGIAHDFNNLLATIEYALKLSISSGVNEQAEDYLNTAVGSVRRGSELTARLLSFAKRQPGLSRSQKAADIIKDFRALIEPSIEETLTLEFQTVDPEIFVFCDGAQLENALLNLVLNSRDAILRAGQGDRIKVSVREVVEADTDFQHLKEQADEAVYRGVAADITKLGDAKGSTRYVEFSVTDNGPGMSIEVKRRALDPFFTTKKTNSGTGLGLSMVYGFVQHSDGELRLYSEEGHGTSVRLLLPGGSSEGQREGPVADLPVKISNNERILIVEDDVQLKHIMAELVRSLGYVVEVAGSGHDAMKMFDDGFECDVLLTDIVMPGGIGGFELGEQVRAIHPQLPIVYMSGYSGFTKAEMGTAIGPFVQKPCAPSELSYAIADAIKSTPDTE